MKLPKKYATFFAIGLLVVLSFGIGILSRGGAFRTAIIPISGSIPALSTADTTKIPVFDHIVVIMLENHSYRQVIGSSSMPVFNKLANKNVLLTQYYAPAHPSLPNYIALIGGDTFGVKGDCIDCFLNQTSLPDLIEASGRTWKTYQENMPSPCFLGNSGTYVQKHNPFVYFDPIRKDTARCEEHVLPMSELDSDLAAGHFPNFAFIMPNQCNSGHSCPLSDTDAWLKQMVEKLQGSPAIGKKSLIFLAFEESTGEDTSSCCGMPDKAGGHVAAVLISPLARSGFKDSTPLSHYSLLKTISAAWSLPQLGYAAKPETAAITAPWK